MKQHESTSHGIRKHAWPELPREALTAQMTRRTVSGERLTLAQYEFVAGSVVPTHAHPNEQITYVLQGVLRIWVGEDADAQGDERCQVIAANEFIVIPAGVPHRAVAARDTVSLDI